MMMLAGGTLHTTHPIPWPTSNSLQTGNVFDPLNRLTQTYIATSSPACSAGTKLASYAYTLGAAGERRNVLELNSRNVAYDYDNDYRLKSEAITFDPAGNNGTVTYTGYDNVGNRTSMTSNLSGVPSGTFSYDNNDRLNIDTWDANGNTTSSGGISNTYDFENRLLTHGAVTIVYDGDGNRVSETAGGVTTKYLVDDLNPTSLPQVVDEVVNGSVTRTYAYGLQRISENQLVGSTWTPRFYGYDGHGNVRFLTNTAGTVTDTYQYDAFGMPIASTGTTSNNYLYAGEQFDSSVGWYQLRQRWYKQAVGRFTTRDPDEGVTCTPLSLNPYIYASDDPVDQADPTGEQAILESVFLATSIFGTTGGARALGQQINCGYQWEASFVVGVAQNIGYAGLTFPKTGACQETVKHPEPQPPCNPGKGGAGPPKFKGFSAADQADLSQAIDVAANGLRKTCCAGSDSGDIANTLQGATYVYNSKLKVCGEVGMLSFFRLRHVIELGPASFGAKCCLLTSTITHEAVHLRTHLDPRAYDAEKKCFGCGR